MLKRIAIFTIRLYQSALSPLTPAACRYVPTCSEYARQSIERFGAARGGWLALRRLFRCHPFGGRGYDPVPRPHDSAGPAKDPVPGAGESPGPGAGAAHEGASGCGDRAEGGGSAPPPGAAGEESVPTGGREGARAHG